MTEFRPIQEKVCDENFWKACKITFREVAYNYTLETCMTPLVEKCDPPGAQGLYGAPQEEPKEVCRTWFESQCNTTYVQSADGSSEPKPSTWCEKVPKKICAPDYCKMVPGEEECHDKTISSTVVRPEEVCDLQPSTQCRLITNLVPHLVPRQVCKDIPKEVCHLKLDEPKVVKKPVTLRWCTRPEKEETAQPVYSAPAQPSYSQVWSLTQFYSVQFYVYIMDHCIKVWFGFRQLFLMGFWDLRASCALLSHSCFLCLSSFSKAM